MLQKRDRLTRDEVAHLGPNARRVRAASLSLRYLPAPGTAPGHKARSKFGVVVSKKVAKSAVGRHLLRRRLYAAIREKRSVLPFAVHGMLIASPHSAGCSWHEIAAEVEQLFRRVV